MGDYYVITGRSINQSTKKCFLRENYDIGEYNMDTEFGWDWGD